jgi:hypothetical protein
VRAPSVNRAMLQLPAATDATQLLTPIAHRHVAGRSAAAGSRHAHRESDRNGLPHPRRIRRIRRDCGRGRSGVDVMLLGIRIGQIIRVPRVRGGKGLVVAHRGQGEVAGAGGDRSGAGVSAPVVHCDRHAPGRGSASGPFGHHGVTDGDDLARYRGIGAVRSDRSPWCRRDPPGSKPRARYSRCESRPRRT